MLLADLGADVVRVDRPGGQGLGIDPAHDVTNRNKRSVLVDLKSPGGAAAVLALAARADILVEGWRPGTAERLGVGPEPCLARNPRLVYGRMTGWGQDGPLAPARATTSPTSPSPERWPSPGRPTARPPRRRTCSATTPAAPSTWSPGCSPPFTTPAPTASAKSWTRPSWTAPPT